MYIFWFVDMEIFMVVKHTLFCRMTNFFTGLLPIFNKVLNYTDFIHYIYLEKDLNKAIVLVVLILRVVKNTVRSNPNNIFFFLLLFVCEWIFKPT